MNRVKIVIMGVLMVVSLAVIAIAAENMGRVQFNLDGGGRGDVDFPHKLHQDTLGDCSVCHDIFPQEIGGIERLKAEKKLKRKQVMNDSCTACHKNYKAKGKKFGPIRCNTCHQR